MPDVASLPAAARALGRAYLPELSLRDLVQLGGTLRGKDHS